MRFANCGDTLVENLKRSLALTSTLTSPQLLKTGDLRNTTKPFDFALVHELQRLQLAHDRTFEYDLSATQRRRTTLLDL